MKHEFATQLHAPNKSFKPTLLRGAARFRRERMRGILAASAIALFSACHGTGCTGLATSGFPVGECPRPQGAPQAVSIAAVTQNPGRYEGAFIRLSGNYCSSFEHSAVYPNAAQAPCGQEFRTGIWLFGVAPGLADRHLEMTGFFTRTFKGHLSRWPGSICVTSVREVTPDAS